MSQSSPPQTMTFPMVSVSVLTILLHVSLSRHRPCLLLLSGICNFRDTSPVFPDHRIIMSKHLHPSVSWRFCLFDLLKCLYHSSIKGWGLIKVQLHTKSLQEMVRYFLNEGTVLAILSNTLKSQRSHLHRCKTKNNGPWSCVKGH